jgi:beta-galactosidase
MTWLLLAFAIFPVSVWYGGGKARAPMLEDNPRARKEVWRKDVRDIKQTGFNAIRGWIDWASAEPEEGKYNFETLDVLADLAREEGLKLIVQVYMDSAPDWVGVRYPESLYTAASGARIKPEAAPGYCRDHTGVRDREIAFFSALSKHIGKHPAFLGWDLWSEPHVINWANATWMPNAEYCFCPGSVGRFRAWLRSKYKTLDALNAAWYRRFTSWEQVEPNRLSTILSYTDYIDWRTFIQQKLGEDLRDRYKAVKQFAPGAVATSHAAAPSLFTSPLAGDGSPDDWISAGRSTSTARASIRSIRILSVATPRGAARSSTSPSPPVMRMAETVSGSASYSPASERSR